MGMALVNSFLISEVSAVKLTVRVHGKQGGILRNGKTLFSDLKSDVNALGDNLDKMSIANRENTAPGLVSRPSRGVSFTFTKPNVDPLSTSRSSSPVRASAPVKKPEPAPSDDTRKA